MPIKIPISKNGIFKITLNFRRGVEDFSAEVSGRIPHFLKTSQWINSPIPNHHQRMVLFSVSSIVSGVREVRSIQIPDGHRAFLVDRECSHSRDLVLRSLAEM
jgi:hypothetical protein